MLWHDAWKPEVCIQRSTAETFIARQRLAKARFSDNEYACINQSIVPNEYINEFIKCSAIANVLVTQ
jgi:hypothetical protein